LVGSQALIGLNDGHLPLREVVTLAVRDCRQVASLTKFVGDAEAGHGRVDFGDEDGNLRIYERGKACVVVAEFPMESAIYSTPVVANDTLYLGTRNRLWAIKEGAQAMR